ncbi:unnamed protein product [Caenorhabditis angaria]|uniref:Uncharacterized protein n=1 Tax=Caenorhabditis angaria TaxID=860376 RepID=A0A9P1J2P8_9PELO|nr:unnamed protein product [Caenorhabditis angaria]
MPGIHTFYDGSRVLEPIANKLGIECDRFNFVLSMFTSLGIAYIYRKTCVPGKVNRQVRFVIPPVVGIALLFFCFGRAIKHLLANALGSYALMYFAPPSQVHKLVFIFSMGYLFFIHCYRWAILDSYSLDITGPIMVAVEKVTMMAFNLKDGKEKDDSKLTAEQKKEAIKDIPSLLEFMSFMFNFQTVLTGPANSYSDYLNFLEGTHVQKDKNGKLPSPSKTAFRKLGQAIVFLVIVATLGSKYKVEDVGTEEYYKLPMYQWFFWWFFTITLVRCTYYFAWVFADAVCNMSGFGFSGYDKNGNAEWKLCTNVLPYQVESAQSLKEILDGWNIQTMYWLRKIAYERAPKKYSTIATYSLSAVWHGVSIGYYMAFFTCGLFTVAGATWRRCMRWRALYNPNVKLVYDIFSFIMAKIALHYATFSFVTMNLHPAVDVLARVYFIPHFVAFAILFGLPKFFKPLKKPDTTSKKSPEIINPEKQKLLEKQE